MGEPIIVRLSERTWYDLTNGIHYHQASFSTMVYVNKQMLDHNSTTPIHDGGKLVARLEWLADVEEERFRRILDNQQQAAADTKFLAENEAATKQEG